MAHEQLLPQTFQRLSDDYEKALEWLTSTCEIDTQSPLVDYAKILADLAAVDSRMVPKMMIENADVRAAYFEAPEIIEVHRSFASVATHTAIPKALTDKLRKRRFSYVDEKNENDESRDTFFQLYIANRLIQNGFPVTLTENEADVVTQFEEHTIFVECKRVQSPTKLVKNLNKAFSQLEGRYTERKHEAGIVFLSVDKVLNPDLEVLKAASAEEAFSDCSGRVIGVGRVAERLTTSAITDKSMGFFCGGRFSLLDRP